MYDALINKTNVDADIVGSNMLSVAASKYAPTEDVPVVALKIEQLVERAQ